MKFDSAAALPYHTYNSLFLSLVIEVTPSALKVSPR